jgi:hypothetical protein
VAQDGSGHRFTVGNGRTMPFVSEIEGELPAHDGKSTIITADDLINLELDPGKPNLACCESLAGRTADAVEHLRRAIEMSDEFRVNAKDDADLDPIRDEPAFKQLVGD